MPKSVDAPGETRRGSGAEETAYVLLVGERVRLERIRRSLSRKLLSQTSGVSERYLAELERGAANPSLLVLRQIGAALGLKVAHIASEDPDRPIDLTLLMHQLERLAPDQIAEARALIAERFANRGGRKRRIALIGLRGAGKTTLGQAAAAALHLPLVELDQEIERVSGVELAEIFARHGHAHYRRLERECLQATLDARSEMVIVAGGGIVTATETFDLLLSACFVIWVRASPATHMARAHGNGHLAAAAPSVQAIAEFRAIFAARAPLYAKADAVIDTTQREPGAAVDELLRLIGPAVAGTRPGSVGSATP